MAKRFKHDLSNGAAIQINPTERGQIVGRAQYLNGENQYLIRYINGHGVTVEQWWAESALIEVDA